MNIQIQDIDVDKIKSSQIKIRPINDETVSELANSIKSKGLLQPILVRQCNEFYEIIFGEHRFLAAKKLGLKVIPCLVENIDELESLEMKLVENIQRNNFVDPDIEGKIFYELLQKKYRFVNDLSDAIGKPTAYISDRISIYRNLDESLKPLVVQKKISLNNSITISRIADHKEQIKLANQIMEVKEKNYIREMFGVGQAKAQPQSIHIYCTCPVCGNYHENKKVTKFDD